MQKRSMYFKMGFFASYKGIVFLSTLANTCKIWHIHLENNLNLFEAELFFSTLESYFDNILDFNDILDWSDTEILSNNRHIWRGK